MKKLLVTTSILTSLFTSNSIVWAKDQGSGECLSEYRHKHKKKNDRYKKAIKRFHDRRKAGQNAILNSGGRITGGAIIGSAMIQNNPVPKKEEFNMFEKDILDIVDYNGQSYKPKLLQEIYDQAYEQYSDITSYKKIQDIVNMGFNENKFCSFFGNYNGKRVAKYVLKYLKKESSNSAVVRDPAVVNSKENLKENKDYSEEINNPTESSSRGIDE